MQIYIKHPKYQYHCPSFQNSGQGSKARQRQFQIHFKTHLIWEGNSHLIILILVEDNHMPGSFEDAVLKNDGRIKGQPTPLDSSVMSCSH